MTFPHGISLTGFIFWMLGIVAGMVGIVWIGLE